MRVCPCENPGWCDYYKRNITGRLWELCNMDNELGESYRNLWNNQGSSSSSSMNSKISTKKITTGDCKCNKKKGKLY